MAPPTRDFKKRPKAKVGKRAPAKLNATDTAFKTASVAVRSQDQSLQKRKHITKQSQVQDASADNSTEVSLELASSRGNVLSTLQSSLRHHAPAVRASGLKGIRDAVQSLSLLEATLGTTILDANLPSLIPNMCRSWLDEDDDVRSIAIKLFGDIIKHLSSSSEQSDLKCLAPFVPILVAYASSALNSLDRSIRKDGASIVGILASSDPSPSYVTISSSSIEDRNFPAITTETGKYIYLFIPPLERLLLSMSFGGHERSNTGSNEVGSNKRKRGENKTKQLAGSTVTAKDSVLLSVAFLLRASLEAEKNVYRPGRNSRRDSCRYAPSLIVLGECTFSSGGSAHTNSLLLFREGISESLSPVRNIFGLPSLSIEETIDVQKNDKRVQDNSLIGQSSSQSDSSLIENIQVLNSLLETIRAKFVELIHSGRKPTTDNGLLMCSADLDILDTLIRTIRFIHQHCMIHQARVIGRTYPNISTDGNQREQKNRGMKAIHETQDIGQCIAIYQATVQKTLLLLLETFPIFSLDGKSASRYELTNAGICSALAELGGGENRLPANDTRNSSQWINAVFSYVLPRLDSTNEMGDDSTGEVATNMLLNVLDKLLLPSSIQCGSDCREQIPSYLLADPLKRQELLQAFAEAFFPRFLNTSTIPDATDIRISQLAKTAVGKSAAMLLVTFITHAGDLSNAPFDVEVELHEKRTILLLQMSSVLPFYIKSWKGSLPTETGRVLSALFAIVRQWSPSSNGTLVEDVSLQPIKRSINEVCLDLRCSLDSLYTTSTKMPSIFELLSDQVQRLAVGLIGMLGCPSEALTKSLSKICSKSYGRRAILRADSGDARISNDLASYIMEVMHSLRKTLPMSSYIAFLIDSSGINHAADALAMSNQTPAKDTVGSSANSLMDTVYFYDRNVEQLSRFLTSSCDQSTTKVLPMIVPILQAWLSPNYSASDDIVMQVVHARAATSVIAAFAWDNVLSCGVARVDLEIVPSDFVKLDEAFGQILVDSIIRQFELSARLWSINGDGIVDDPIERSLARLLGPVTILLRYCHGILEKFIVRVSRRIVQECTENTAAEFSGGSSEPTVKNDVSSHKTSVTEVLVKTLLLILKSKYPASITELVRSRSMLSDTLLSAAAEIEIAMSRGHLAHLGSKFSHQVKLLKR